MTSCKIFRRNIHVHSNIITVMYFHLLFHISFLKPTPIFCFSTIPGRGVGTQFFIKGVQNVMKKWNKLDRVQMKSKRSMNNKLKLKLKLKLVTLI